jgi:hypothetical protein
LVRIHVDRLEPADTTDKGGSMDTCGKVGEGAVSAVETVLAELEDLLALTLWLELEATDRAFLGVGSTFTSNQSVTGRLRGGRTVIDSPRSRNLFIATKALRIRERPEVL